MISLYLFLKKSDDVKSRRYIVKHIIYRIFKYTQIFTVHIKGLSSSGTVSFFVSIHDGSCFFLKEKKQFQFSLFFIDQCLCMNKTMYQIGRSDNGGKPSFFNK